MALKRSRSSEQRDDDASALAVRQLGSTCSPSKRLRWQAESFPRTPATARFKSAFSTPAKTPYPLRAYDSPSNPFGRKHTESLIRRLPPSTSYSKHLALRFQFVRKGIPSRKGGVHRVAQVPLSYTFVHLRCLVSFLFGGDLLEGTQRAEDQVDHLFEIKKDTVLYSMTYKPGQIKKGQTWAKLSSTRDPCRWRDEEEIDDEEEVDEAEEEGRLLEEEDDWEWKDEEEFTLAHAWPDGLNMERGIIYYHSRSTQVHITVNSGKLPRRKGSGNTPHIFSAQGRVYLSSAPLPRVLFKPLPKKRIAISKFALRSGKSFVSEAKQSDEREDPDTLELDGNHPFNIHQNTELRKMDNEPDSDQEDDLESEPEDFQVNLNPKKWNAPLDVFSTYLRRYMGPSLSVKKPFTLLDDQEEEDQLDYSDEALDDTLICTPDLIQSLTSSSPPPGSSSPGSFPLSSSPPHKPYTQLPSPSVYSPSQFPESQFFLKAKYKQTPAPPRDKVHRMRIGRVERRMERSKQRELLKDEGEGETQNAANWDGIDEEDGNREIDQLVGEDDDADSVFVPPTLNEGEVWDPFGDEEEV